MYAEMIDGLRSHYETRTKDKASAGYHAAMSMSFLFGVCAAALCVVVDGALTGELGFVIWAHDHWPLIALFGVGTAWGHVRYAKHRNVYHNVGPPKSSAWRSWFAAYCMTALVLLLMAVVMAYRLRLRQ